MYIKPTNTMFSHTNLCGIKSIERTIQSSKNNFNPFSPFYLKQQFQNKISLISFYSNDFWWKSLLPLHQILMCDNAQQDIHLPQILLIK